MPGFYLHTSNNLEILLNNLAEKISQNPLPPLIPETIVIQSRGMEKWLSLKLSKKSGIWANAVYPFPNKAVETILKSIFPVMPEDRLFDSEIISFTLMKLFPEIYSSAEFSDIRDYISSGNSIVKTYQISKIIADLFDQYITFRPDMISDWDSGKDKSWQAILWKKLRAVLPEIMPHEYKKLFFKNISQVDPSKLPSRIFIFGVSYMPNFHLDIIRAASEFIDIHIYMLNPCRQYWFSIKSEKEIDRITEKTGKHKNDLHIEEGNRLLASWGKSGREFLKYLYDLDPIDNEESLFMKSDSGSILDALKNSILDLSDPEKRVMDEKKIHEDKSIRIHSCHSQIREIEILYDNILNIFSRYKNIKPDDILVMTPDIESYSRFIHAVFSGGEIPYAISDRSLFAQNSIIDVFFKIIEFPSTRFESDKVLEILENDDVRKKFSLTGEEIEKIKNWISDTNTAWGFDIDHKKKLGLPEYKENTWEMFRNRILLGFALPRGNNNYFNGILPYDKIQGKDSFALGNFLDYLDYLNKYYHLLSDKNTLSGWSEILNSLIADFFQKDESIDNLNSLIENLNYLKDIQIKSEFKNNIELSIVKDFLSGKLKNQRISANYLNGSVTFCEMLPMRSIPFKIICMIGMNDGSYPRNIKPVSFDLLKENPKPGDRNIRDEDRYLFLETLISAEKELYISYIGQNINDNSTIPPSVIVSEFTDYLESFISVDNGTAISDHILIRHRLQGFSLNYFYGNLELFSYSKENYLVAENLKSIKSVRPSFYKNTFETPEYFYESITNQTLINFFKNPSKFFTKEILGINLDPEDLSLETNEKFTLDNLDIYKIGSRAYSALIYKNETELLTEMKAEGSIPHGNMGEVLVNKTVLEFIDAINEIGIESDPESFSSSIKIDGTEILFQIDNVFKEGILQIKNSSINAQFFISAWINHLLINSLQKHKSLIAAKEDKKLTLWILKEIDQEESLNHLKSLLGLFKKGTKSPFLFMPGISFKTALEKNPLEIKLPDDADFRYFNLIFGDFYSNKSEIKNNTDFLNNSLSICIPIIENLNVEKNLQ